MCKRAHFTLLTTERMRITIYVKIVSASQRSRILIRKTKKNRNRTMNISKIHKFAQFIQRHSVKNRLKTKIAFTSDGVNILILL